MVPGYHLCFRLAAVARPDCHGGKQVHRIYLSCQEGFNQLGPASEQAWFFNLNTLFFKNTVVVGYQQGSCVCDWQVADSQGRIGLCCASLFVQVKQGKRAGCRKKRRQLQKLAACFLRGDGFILEKVVFFHGIQAFNGQPRLHVWGVLCARHAQFQGESVRARRWLLRADGAVKYAIDQPVDLADGRSVRHGRPA